MNLLAEERYFDRKLQALEQSEAMRETLIADRIAYLDEIANDIGSADMMRNLIGNWLDDPNHALAILCVQANTFKSDCEFGEEARRFIKSMYRAMSKTQAEFEDERGELA